MTISLRYSVELVRSHEIGQSLERVATSSTRFLLTARDCRARLLRMRVAATGDVDQVQGVLGEELELEQFLTRRAGSLA